MERTPDPKAKPLSAAEKKFLESRSAADREEEDTDFAEEFTTSGTAKENWDHPADGDSGQFLI